MANLRREILALLALVRGKTAAGPARAIGGDPYRSAMPEATREPPASAPFSGVEVIAWLVVFASSVARVIFGIVRSDLDACDTLIACISVALALLAFSFRSAR
jgi:hypothetical protein